jgi:hypothetical protein
MICVNELTSLKCRNKADRVDSTEWWLHAEAVGEFLYNEDGKETDHAPLDMPEKLGEKIIVTI